MRTRRPARPLTSAAAATLALLAAGGLLAPPAGAAVPPVRPVAADGETAPVTHAGDAADDPAIWVHPTTPADSLVLGNDKQGALETYDLDGTLHQRVTTAVSFWGNVDVRQGVQVGGRTLDVVATYNGGLRLFTVGADRMLQQVSEGRNGAIATGGGEGLCLYDSTVGGLSAFVVTRPGRVRQYAIADKDGDGLLQGTLVREFQVGSEAEGCVADEQTQALYVSQEDVGLWRYGAEPSSGATRVSVDTVQPDGHLVYDVEGVTVVRTGTGGYLIASAQNGAAPKKSYFTVYDRVTNDYQEAFRVVDGTNADGCQRTDGITAYAGDLGPLFPQGLFVCQDNSNTVPGQAGNQSFKLVRLEKVVALP